MAIVQAITPAKSIAGALRWPLVAVPHGLAKSGAGIKPALVALLLERQSCLNFLDNARAGMRLANQA